MPEHLYNWLDEPRGWDRKAASAFSGHPIKPLYMELQIGMPPSVLLIVPSQERDGQNEREQAVAEGSLRRWDEIKREGKQGEQQSGNTKQDTGDRTALRAAAGRWIAVILLPAAVR